MRKKTNSEIIKLSQKAEVLSQVGVKSVYTAYIIVQIFIFIAAIFCVIGGIFECIIGGTLIKQFPNVWYYKLIIVGGIIAIFFGPLHCYLSWLVIKPFIARLYDIKLIRYKLYPDYQEETMCIIKNEITDFEGGEHEKYE